MTKGFERFCATSSNQAQAQLARAVAKLTKNGLEDGFEIDEIIDYLSFMVQCEAEVAADVHEETYWSDSINQGLGLDNLQRRHQ
jgi:hypothetical protein